MAVPVVEDFRQITARGVAQQKIPFVQQRHIRLGKLHEQLAVTSIPMPISFKSMGLTNVIEEHAQQTVDRLGHQPRKPPQIIRDPHK